MELLLLTVVPIVGRSHVGMVVNCYLSGVIEELYWLLLIINNHFFKVSRLDFIMIHIDICA